MVGQLSVLNMFNILPMTDSVDVNRPKGLYIGQVGTGSMLVELESGDILC